MLRKDLISVRDAAEEKAVSRQAIYRALDEGRLSEYRAGRIRLVKRDRKYRDFEARPYGEKRQSQQ